MTYVKKGYVCRRVAKGKGRIPDDPHASRNWWLLKGYEKRAPSITLAKIVFPMEYIGKKVRLKIEILEDAA